MLWLLKAPFKESHYLFHNGKTAVRIKKISHGKINGISQSCSCTEGRQSSLLEVGKEVNHRRKPILLGISTASHAVSHLLGLPLCQIPPLKYRLGLGNWRQSSHLKSCFDSLMPHVILRRHCEELQFSQSDAGHAMHHQKQRPGPVIQWRLILPFLPLLSLYSHGL